MKLLTKDLERRMPAMRATEGQGDAAVAVAKFFKGGYTWYAVELDLETGEFYGLVDGQFVELGYFNVADLESVGAERDLYWRPTTISACRFLCTGIQTS